MRFKGRPVEGATSMYFLRSKFKNSKTKSSLLSPCTTSNSLTMIKQNLLGLGLNTDTLESFNGITGNKTGCCAVSRNRIVGSLCTIYKTSGFTNLLRQSIYFRSSVNVDTHELDANDAITETSLFLTKGENALRYHNILKQSIEL